MNLNKQAEKEMLEVYEAYWANYLKGDVQAMIPLLDDEYTQVGSAESEVFFNKQDAVQFLHDTISQVAGQVEMRNRITKIEPHDTFILISELTDVYTRMEEEWNFYAKFRASSMLHLRNGTWLIFHQHSSFPDARTGEGENLAIEKISQENLQLREAVKRRTTELEYKNKELEIEAALERVRTVAMSMSKPDNLMDICQVVYTELCSLGFHELRNAMINIYQDNKSSFLNYDYAITSGKTVTVMPYDIHPLIEKQVMITKNAGDAFYEFSFAGQELKDFRELRKNNGEQDDPKLDDAPSLNYYFYSIGNGSIGISAYGTISNEKLEQLKRFRNVFDFAYRRYTDVAEAEAQAREARIELALERVRARTMAMQRSEEMVEASHVLFNELQALGIETIRTGVATVDAEHETVTVWSSQLVEKNDTLILGVVPRKAHPFFDGYFDAWKKKELYFTYSMTGDEVKSYYTTMSSILSYPLQSEFKPKETFTVFFFPEGSLNVISHEPLSDDSCQILVRFARVFGLIYRRFLDLKLAEEQAREAQIELALERIRARTMAMQRSDELSETAQILFQQFKFLGETPIQITIGIIHEDEGVIEFNVTDSSGIGNKIDQAFRANIHEAALMQKMHAAWKEQKKSISLELTGQDLLDWVAYRISLSGLENPGDHQIESHHRRFVTAGFFSKGLISISTLEPFPKGTIPLLERFAAVFDQTYIRFLDLQKAEEQARESQIEAALERIRSRTMGMQKSEELKEVIRVVYKQFVHLNIHIEHTGFFLDYRAREDMHIWLADDHEVPAEITIPYFDSPHWNSFNDAKEKGSDFFVNHLSFDEKNKFYRDLFNLIPGVSEKVKDHYFQCPGLAISTVLLDNVGLYIENFSGIPYSDEENITLMRFGKVFQQTYTRFLDLQKAEAQSRESQVEAGLERVRSRTLAMHSSSELAETAAVVFRQLIQLGIAPTRLYIGIVKDDTGDIELWATDEDGSKVNTQFTGNIHKSIAIQNMYDGWKAQLKSITIDMEGKELSDYFHYLHDELNVPFKFGLDQKRRVQNIAYFSQGFIGIASPEPQPEETITLLERFATVFNLTYTRFNDLQHAEQQTQKAKIEVALERVRARALAMQQPEELVEVAQVMRLEMGLLGVEELETSSIYIHDDHSDVADCWYAISDLRAPEKKLVADHITMELHKTWVGKQMLDFFNSNEQQISIIMQGANRIEWIKYCAGISTVLQDFYGEIIPDRTYHLYKFSNGAIGAASEGDISDESWELLRRATSVFSLAYSRFKDLTQSRLDLQRLKEEKQRAENALTELKATQSQLIQSEKMASLGELTAGIAHEIQNPLNFVNNFSEINSELIEEMKTELAEGRTEDAITIANDIADNEQKINHHGKRADAIVKGMLQHSRTSSGIKEPTDINALADEYLRLAYHGLRAKDKSFNANMKTDFDSSIGLINVIPQDIGRVILNLITNAFYVVNERKQQKPENYEPMVIISTRKSENKIFISIKDNGNGIPQVILDKIFQPFFTTKPTGQGTGLGLSLSYDIVKAHAGDLKVETKESEGTIFTISLPFLK